MFTGLVEGLGLVMAVEADPPGQTLQIELSALADGVTLGDSIALNGCCLTVVQLAGTLASFQAGPETLERTNLGCLSVGGKVNVERSLRVGDRLGGHYVTGHVDALGTLHERLDDREWSTFWFRMPPSLSAQLASKGSIAVDGVSLTLVDVETDRFSVALIPHTLQQTTLGALTAGATVNLETDVLAKYVQRQLQATQ